MPPTPESVIDDAVALLHEGLAIVRQEMDAIRAGTAKRAGGKRGRDPVLRVSFLSRSAAQIADAVRKVEKERARRLEQLTPALVLAWLRSVDPTERDQVIREAMALAEKRNGLG